MPSVKRVGRSGDRPTTGETRLRELLLVGQGSDAGGGGWGGPDHLGGANAGAAQVVCAVDGESGPTVDDRQADRRPRGRRVAWRGTRQPGGSGGGRWARTMTSVRFQAHPSGRTSPVDRRYQFAASAVVAMEAEDRDRRSRRDDRPDWGKNPNGGKLGESRRRGESNQHQYQQARFRKAFHLSLSLLSFWRVAGSGGRRSSPLLRWQTVAESGHKIRSVLVRSFAENKGEAKPLPEETKTTPRMRLDVILQFQEIPRPTTEEQRHPPVCIVCKVL